jgi:hypothetical protein
VVAKTETEEIFVIECTASVRVGNTSDLEGGRRSEILKMDSRKKVVQTEKDIDRALDRICDDLLKRHPELKEMVLVGDPHRRSLSGRSPS